MRTQLLTLFNQRDQAWVKTEREREELMALYAEAQAWPRTSATQWNSCSAKT